MVKHNLGIIYNLFRIIFLALLTYLNFKLYFRPKMATASSVLDCQAERGNFQRVTNLLIEHGTSVLRETFDSIIPPAQLTIDLNDPRVEAKLRRSKTNEIRLGHTLSPVRRYD